MNQRHWSPLEKATPRTIMRILIATDAWRPQVNGVVHTLEATARAAKSLGAEICFLTPEGFPTVVLPSYPAIRLALPHGREIARRIATVRPDAVHVATEGPIGYYVQRFASRSGARSPPACIPASPITWRRVGRSRRDGLGV